MHIKSNEITVATTKDNVSFERNVKYNITRVLSILHRGCSIYRRVVSDLETIKKQSLDEIIAGAMNFYVGVPANLLEIWKYFTLKTYPKLRDRNAVFKGGIVQVETVFYAMGDYHRHLSGCPYEYDCPKLTWEQFIQIAIRIDLRKINDLMSFVAILGQLIYGTRGAKNFAEAEFAFKNRYVNYLEDQAMGYFYDDILERGGYLLHSSPILMPDQEQVWCTRRSLEIFQYNLRLCVALNKEEWKEQSNCFDGHVTTLMRDFEYEIENTTEGIDISILLHIQLKLQRTMNLTGIFRYTTLFTLTKIYSSTEVHFVEHYDAMQNYDEDVAIATLLNEVLDYLREEMKSYDLNRLDTMTDTNSDEYSRLILNIRYRLQEKFDFFERQFFAKRMLSAIFFNTFYQFLKELRATPDKFKEGLFELRNHLYPLW